MFSVETRLRLKQFLSRLTQTLSRQQNSVISTSLMMLKHRVLCSLNEVISQGLREFFQAPLGDSLARWLWVTLVPPKGIFPNLQLSFLCLYSLRIRGKTKAYKLRTET